MLARLLKIPYTIGLVLAGIGLAYVPSPHQIELSKELIFVTFLPALVFEAALYIRWRELQKDLWVVLTLATLGVAISAGITAAGMHYLAGWDWPVAFVFGILIAATDPVSVIATFKEAGVHGRLRLLVEAESLFNDSTAAIGFGIALTLAMGQTTDVASTVSLLISSIGRVFLGIHCLCRKLIDFYLDWGARISRKFWLFANTNFSGNCNYAHRTSLGNLSIVRVVYEIDTTCQSYPSTRFILGWITRCPRSSFGIRTTNSNATSLGNYYCHFWGCRFFGLRSRLNDEAHVASDGRN
jgi:hypothetical protein